MTPIIEAVCNSIDSIGNLPNGTIDIMAIRDGQKSYEGNTSVSGSIIGFDIGLGYRVRTLPQGFLSPTRGTERVAKTIEDRSVYLQYISS